MCVWSAFVGKKNAAQEVFNIGKSIEGFWSGFYTGIATVDNNGIHSAKCCGYSKLWLEKFNLNDFSGTTGFFHSRTNSGGNEHWGHPFLGTNKKVAIISQGCDGVFSDMTPWEKLANTLFENNKKFTTQNYNIPVKRYPMLKDNSKVHSAEVIANAVEYFYEASGDALSSIKEFWQQTKEEAVTLFIFDKEPDKIYFINMNQRAALYFTNEGTYAASTALAFDLPLAKYTELPLNSVGFFTSNSLYSENLPEPGYPLFDRIPNDVLINSLRFLNDNPNSSLAQITDSGFGHLFPKEGIKLRAITAYRLIEFLFSQGWVESQNQEVPGPENSTGLITTFSLTKQCKELFSLQ